MAYPAKAVANEFLRLTNADGKTISPMKLLKLVYFAHGWNLAFSGQPLIKDRVEAWKYGPVIPELYHEFKHFGNDPITENATEVYFTDDNRLAIQAPFIPSADKEAQELIQKVWASYGPFSATQLSNSTHKPGTPWASVYDPAKRNLVIPDEVIKKYYDDLLKKANA